MKYLGLGAVIILCCAWLNKASADALEGKKSPAEIIAAAQADHWRTIDPAQVIVIDVARGQITIELSDTFAQRHVAQIKTLVKAGFYDGLNFYRVIDGFVAQAGDVVEKRTLPEGAVKGLRNERDEDFGLLLTEVIDEQTNPELDGRELTQGFFKLPDDDGYAEATGYLDGFPVGYDVSHKDNQKAWLLHCTGAVAMARDTDLNTGSTEFYITLQPQRYLDRNLTVFGRVIDGMEHVQALKRQPAPTDDTGRKGDRIFNIWMGDEPPAGQSISRWQVLDTDTELFAKYVKARRNRPEAFFYHRPDHLDVCQLPIPVRRDPNAPKPEIEIKAWAVEKKDNGG